jgi:hypothetical protein
MFEDDDLGYEEHLRDSQNLGDPRRCPRHPHVATSSPDGMFDGLCGECEAEMDMAAEDAAMSLIYCNACKQHRPCSCDDMEGDRG